MKFFTKCTGCVLFAATFFLLSVECENLVAFGLWSYFNDTEIYIQNLFYSYCDIQTGIPFKKNYDFVYDQEFFQDPIVMQEENGTNVIFATVGNDFVKGAYLRDIDDLSFIKFLNVVPAKDMPDFMFQDGKGRLIGTQCLNLDWTPMDNFFFGSIKNDELKLDESAGQNVQPNMFTGEFSLDSENNVLYIEGMQWQPFTPNWYNTYDLNKTPFELIKQYAFINDTGEWTLSNQFFHNGYLYGFWVNGDANPVHFGRRKINDETYEEKVYDFYKWPDKAVDSDIQGCSFIPKSGLLYCSIGYYFPISKDLNGVKNYWVIIDVEGEKVEYMKPNPVGIKEATFSMGVIDVDGETNIVHISGKSRSVSVDQKLARVLG